MKTGAPEGKAMMRVILKSKIHRATITEANLYYEGSITIDPVLMEKAGILQFEKVEVFNLNNGERFETYAIEGERNRGGICLNGPAARSGCVGDQIIIVCYALVDEKEAQAVKPKIAKVDENNRIKN